MTHLCCHPTHPLCAHRRDGPSYRMHASGRIAIAAGRGLPRWHLVVQRTVPHRYRDISRSCAARPQCSTVLWRLGGRPALLALAVATIVMFRNREALLSWQVSSSYTGNAPPTPPFSAGRERHLPLTHGAACPLPVDGRLFRRQQGVNLHQGTRGGRVVGPLGVHGFCGVFCWPLLQPQQACAAYPLQALLVSPGRVGSRMRSTVCSKPSPAGRGGTRVRHAAAAPVDEPGISAYFIAARCAVLATQSLHVSVVPGARPPTVGQRDVAAVAAVHGAGTRSVARLRWRTQVPQQCMPIVQSPFPSPARHIHTDP